MPIPIWRDRTAHTDALLSAALDAASPARAIRAALRRDGDRLCVRDRVYRLADLRRVLVVGFGKASAAMAAEVENLLGDRITGGVVITKYGHIAPLQRIAVIEAGHPLPDAAGRAGAQRMLELVGHPRRDDLILALISGGGSALLALPAGEVALADLQLVNDGLLRSGVAITEFNAVRKHLSAVKGGQLARRFAPAAVEAIVISDVVGNPPDVIASGPLAPDPTTFADAHRILSEAGLWQQLPSAVREHVLAGLDGSVPETPKPGAAAFGRVHLTIAADNAMAANAVVDRARTLGFKARLISTALEGEAREVGRDVVRRWYSEAISGASPQCLVWGGETTVTVRGHGRGGRNQEAALAAAMALQEVGAQAVRVVCFATDGGDGPTDAAGAVAEPDTVARARAAGLDPEAVLETNDTYTLFSRLGSHIQTGPTGTNVNDLVFVLAY